MEPDEVRSAPPEAPPEVREAELHEEPEREPYVPQEEPQDVEAPEGTVLGPGAGPRVVQGRDD